MHGQVRAHAIIVGKVEQLDSHEGVIREFRAKW